MNTINVYSNKEKIIIKIKEGASQNDIEIELGNRLKELKKFYYQEKNPILVTGKILKTSEIEAIQKIIQNEINVKVEFDIAKTLGLSEIKKTFRKEIATSETKFYKTSLRSGQKVEFEGSIVIIGDVNDGAEVIAEDNIIILGNLRGMAHAGARGNEQAIIAAKFINSNQIRIASKIKEINKNETDTQRTYAFVNEEGFIELS